MMRTHQIGLTLLIGAGFTVFAPLADAGTIGVNWAGAQEDVTWFPGAGAHSLAPGMVAGVGAYAQGNWNNTVLSESNGPTDSSASGTMENLIDGSGAATTVDITYASAQSWAYDPGTSPSNDQVLYSSWFQSTFSADLTLTASQIPYGQYDVVVYFGTPGWNVASGVVQVTDASSNIHSRYYTEHALHGNGGTFTDAGFLEVSDAAISEATREIGNYIVFAGLTGDTFTLALPAALGSADQGVVGIQIVEVPEPASLALLGISGVLLAVRRRPA